LESGRGWEGGQVIGCWATAGGGMSFPVLLLFHSTLPYVFPSFQSSLNFSFCFCLHTTQPYPTHYPTPTRVFPHPFPSQLSLPFSPQGEARGKGGGAGGGKRGEEKVRGGRGEGGGAGGQRWVGRSPFPLLFHPTLLYVSLSFQTSLKFPFCFAPTPPNPTPPTTPPLPVPFPTNRGFTSLCSWICAFCV